MKNFKNSKTMKIATGVLGLALSAMMIAPAIASAMDTTTTMTTSSVTSTTMTSSSYVFTKNLKVGMNDQEVMNLQKVLNMSKDTQIAGSGAGSPGMETMHFGPITKAGVIYFQNKYATEILTPVGLTVGTGYVGASTRAKLNAMGGMMTTGMVPGCTSTSGFSATTGASCSTGVTGGTMSAVPGCMSLVGYSPTTGQACSAMTTGTTTTGTGLSASLDAVSPMSGAIIAGQSVATVGIYKLTNMGSTAAKVTSIKFKRTGISSDTTLNNVYLYNGSSRITDSAAVAQGVVSFNDASGIVTIPAGGSVSLAVRIDVASTNSVGQTVGMMLTDVTSDAGTTAGLPVSGSQMTIATAPAGMTTVDFNAVTSPVTPGNIDPQNDYTMWQNTVNIGSRDALLSAIRFRQLGSVNAGDLKNFRLMIDGVQVGSAVDSVDSRGYVQFAWATPVSLKAGGRTIKLLGDIVGGSSRTFSFSLQQAADAEVWDSQLSVSVLPTANATTFSARSAGTATINQGTLTITKATDSPSGNVVLSGSSVTLGKFAFHAAGEKLKIENLNIGFRLNGSTTLAAQLRNVGIFANGVQIGSTQNVVTTGTVFNLGSSLMLDPGQDVNVEVHGDVFNPVATGGAFVANSTLQVDVLAPAAANVYKTQSFGYFSNGTASGNQMTVASGAITLSKYTAYANQTVTVPQTALKIGEYRLTSGTTEGINADTITLALTGSMTVTDLTNLYVVYGTKTSQIKSTGAVTQSWSINEPIAANGNLSIAVYATLSSIATGNVGTTLVVSGTSQSSGNAVTSGGAVSGQTMTVGTGTITVAIDASTPVAALAVAGSMPKVGSFKFTTSNDAFTIDDLNIHLTTLSAADAGAVAQFVFKDGATELMRQPITSTTGSTSVTGLSIIIPSNSSKIIDVYANLGSIGTGFASTSARVGVTLESFEAMNSNGVKTRTYTTVNSNQMYAYKTKPTITNVALPASVLNSGTQTVGQFTITADAGGTVSWTKIVLNVSATGVGFTSVNIYDSANQSTALANVTVATTSSTMTFTSSADQEVSGSKTYVVKVNITGSPVAGNSFSTSFANSGLGFVASTANGLVGGTATFIWSDESSQPHSLTTQDWNNDFLVKNLPTDSQTLTK